MQSCSVVRFETCLPCHRCHTLTYMSGRRGRQQHDSHLHRREGRWHHQHRRLLIPLYVHISYQSPPPLFHLTKSLLLPRHRNPTHRRSLQIHLHPNQRVPRRNRRQQNPRQLSLAGHRTRRRNPAERPV